MGPSTIGQGVFCWNELATRGVAQALPFYTDLFGWTRRPEEVGTGAPYKMLRHAHEDVAGAYELAGPHFEGVPPHWTTYVLVDDVDEVAARVVPAGGRMVFEPMDIPGVGRMATFADPEGAVLSLFQEGQRKARPDLGARHGAFCWSELYTNDPEGALRFYTEVLPWDGARKDGGPMPYTEWTVGGRSVGGMIQIAPEMGPVPPHWLVYVAVDDCDATVRRAGELGGQVRMPPMTIEGVGRFAILADPTGASIAVITLDPKHC